MLLRLRPVALSLLVTLAAVGPATAQTIEVFPELLVISEGTIFGVQVVCTQCDFEGLGGRLDAQMDDIQFATVTPDSTAVGGNPFVTIFNVKGESQGGTILRIMLFEEGSGVPAAEKTVTVQVHEIDDCPIDDLTRYSFDRAGILDTYRRFRDQVMDATRIGRHYADLYYEHGPEILRILRSDRELRHATRDLLDAYRPVIEAILAGEIVTLSQDEVLILDDVLRRVDSNASRSLQRAIAEIRRELWGGKRFRAMNIRVERGR